jgi:titin
MPANSIRFAQTVPAGVPYQYRVRSCNDVGCSAWAVAAVATVPTSAPAAPFGAGATATAGTRVGLSWTDAGAEEASFTVTRSLLADGSWGAYEAAGNTSANVAQLTVNSLLAGRTYRFQVSACNVVGCSAWTTSPAVTLPTPPAAPISAAGTVLSGTAIRLNWTDTTSNETSFQVSRAIVSSTGTVGTYVDLAAVAANQVQFTATGLDAGTTYLFRVRACNVAGCSRAAVTANLVISPIPATPTGLAATATSSTQVRVIWADAGTSETSYQPGRTLRNTDGTWGAWTVLPSLGANAALLDDSGLLAGRSYRYRVRACGVSGCSAWATSGTVTTPAS